MIHRGIFCLVCWSFAALSSPSQAADDGTGSRGPEPFRASVPYTSVYDDPGASGGDGLAYTRIHRLLAHRLDRMPPGEVVKAWVLFKDKGINSSRAFEGAVEKLQTTFNRRAIERRIKRRTWADLFDEHDLPVVPAYVSQVEATGARVHVTSRWVNGVSVEATAAQLKQIDRLEFIRIIQPVRRSRGIEPLEGPDVEADVGLSAISRQPPTFYGNSGGQLAQINLPGVHDLGFTGKHVIVGILDTGFRTIHSAFNDPAHPLKIVAQWDFVNDDPNVGIEAGDPGNQHVHGTYILGTLGAYKPESLVGAAYDASFILCKTEDVSGEYQAEEDNYVAGLEFIEANGGDMATSSLGYIDWYTQADLDGMTAVTTLAVDIATGNGVHCCTAAGNEYHDANPNTSSLLAPADAFNVITCGAVDSSGNIAGFSSDGPTADGRVKPEVLARGVNTWTVNPNSAASNDTVSGTSLSTPLVAGAVACLIDAFPNWSVEKMREALFETADYFVANGTYDPLYVKGYGIIDTLGALRADCNEDGRDDQAEIEDRVSEDCNENGIPDECERDCNANGEVDACEMSGMFVSRSPHLGPFYDGPTQVHSIASPPEAFSDVTLSFTASATLEAEIAYVFVTLNGVVVVGGSIFKFGAGNCADPPDEAQIVLTPDIYNTIIDDGFLTIRMYPSPDVGVAPCGASSYIAVSVAYEIIPTTPDCNHNLVPDSCDRVGDLDGDGFVSLADYALAVDCMTSPCPGPPCDPALYADPCCVATDFDVDGDFDLKDLASIQLEIVRR